MQVAVAIGAGPGEPHPAIDRRVARRASRGLVRTLERPTGLFVREIGGWLPANHRKIAAAVIVVATGACFARFLGHLTVIVRRFGDLVAVQATVVAGTLARRVAFSAVIIQFCVRLRQWPR